MKVLKKSLGYILGGLIGLGTFPLLFHLGLEAGRQETGPLDFLRLLAYFLVAFVLHLAIHEAGHLVAGLLSGYQFSSYRIFNLMWQKTGDRIRFFLHSIPGTAGQCLMIPPQPVDGKVPYVLYNLGGGLANLLVLPLVYLLSFVGLSREFVLIFVVIGIFMALLNLIPMKDLVANDGHNILSISKLPQGSLYFAAQLHVLDQLIRGRTYKQMDPSFFFKISPEEVTNPIAVSSVFAYINLLMEEEDYAGVKAYIQELDLIDKSPIKIYQTLSKMMLAYCELIQDQPMSVTFEKKEWSLLEALSKSQPSVLVFLYAYYQLVETDDRKAQSYFKILEKLKNSYPFPVEYEQEMKNLTRFQSILDGREIEEV